MMSDVGLDVFVKLDRFPFHFPIADPRLFAAQKLFEIDGLVPGPDSSRAPEVGHARLRADAGAGKENDLPAPSEPVCQFV